jgi:hypothetical protein
MEFEKKMMAEEGIKRKQIARDRFINEGDENTRYFQLIAKERKKKSQNPFPSA